MQLKEDWISINRGTQYVSEEELKFIYSTLRPIVDTAPTQSVFVLEISKEANIFHGILKINSSTQKFMSEVVAPNPYRMVTDLKNDILNKIKFWQQSRFLNNAS
jgi:hypothetical protein